MSYDEVLRWGFGRIDYERRLPQPGDLKLDRMRELLRRLGDPQKRFHSVHVAGSKGKGSTCAMLESVLRAAGYRTGLFTSPHLSDVRERIQVDRQLIERAELVAVAETVRPVVEQLEGENQSPTFFEVITALGFLHFARRGVETAVVEVGLGGRFDATNVLEPLLAIITSISLDHTAILGGTLEKIAFEKAGIIKPGVPVVSGVLKPGPRAVVDQIAAEQRSLVWRLGEEIEYEYVESAVASSNGIAASGTVRVVTPRRNWPEISLPLLGKHQARNAALALASVDLLNDGRLPKPVDRAIAESGLSSVEWPARMEVIGARPSTVLDCAHNVASAEALAETLTTAFPPGPRSLVFAASSDKDVGGMFRVLAPLAEKVYLTRSESPRAFQPDQLAAELTPDVVHAEYDRPIDAWRAAQIETPPHGLIVVAGSVFLAGELRPTVLAAACRS